MNKPLCVAGCQFPVDGDIDVNLQHVLAQIAEAASRGARLAHFPEAALSGYAGVDLDSTSGIDWRRLEAASREVCQAAARHSIWVLLGSTHRLSDDKRPHNSVYVIDDRGSIVERYDKRFCTGTLQPTAEHDLRHYSPGDHATVFQLDGFQCGVLICYDYRFPELYRDLKRRGVQVVFQSFHNARRDEETHLHGNIWKEIVPATMRCRAASNHFWISAVNSTARFSSWPSFFVSPDGRIAGQSPEHQAEVLLSTIDPAEEFWDAPGAWRDNAMAGALHSGELVDDPRSTDRTSL
ncbi:MAG: carbon-nitrogen hydrolase family protein [Pirellulaceae bacterium]